MVPLATARGRLAVGVLAGAVVHGMLQGLRIGVRGQLCAHQVQGGGRTLRWGSALAGLGLMVALRAIFVNWLLP